MNTTNSWGSSGIGHFQTVYCHPVKYIKYTKIQKRKNPISVKNRCCRSICLSHLFMFFDLMIKYIFLKSFIVSTVFVGLTCSFCKISYTFFRKASIYAMHMPTKAKIIIIKKVEFILTYLINVSQV